MYLPIRALVKLTAASLVKSMVVFWNRIKDGLWIFNAQFSHGHQQSIHVSRTIDCRNQSRFLSQSHKHGVHPFPLGSMLDHLDHRNRPWCLLKWPFHIITSIGFSIGFHRHIIEHEAHTIVSDKGGASQNNPAHWPCRRSVSTDPVRSICGPHRSRWPSSWQVFPLLLLQQLLSRSFLYTQSILSCFEMVDQGFGLCSSRVCSCPSNAF